MLCARRGQIDATQSDANRDAFYALLVVDAQSVVSVNTVFVLTCAHVCMYIGVYECMYAQMSRRRFNARALPHRASPSRPARVSLFVFKRQPTNYDHALVCLQLQSSDVFVK